MKIERELLKGVAPVAVLEILSAGEMYGYELSTAVSRRSGNILELGKGTLYPLLYNLEAKGMIKGNWKEMDSGRKRRYYTITSKGMKFLTERKQQWTQLKEAMNAVMGIVPVLK